MSFISKIFKPRPSKIEVFKGHDNRWYFHVVAGNGKITTSSQGYSTKGNATRAAKKSFPELDFAQ